LLSAATLQQDFFLKLKCNCQPAWIAAIRPVAPSSGSLQYELGDLLIVFIEARVPCQLPKLDGCSIEDKAPAHVVQRPTGRLHKTQARLIGSFLRSRGLLLLRLQLTDVFRGRVEPENLVNLSVFQELTRDRRVSASECLMRSIPVQLLVQ
jgi:hypothetical protein